MISALIKIRTALLSGDTLGAAISGLSPIVSQWPLAEVSEEFNRITGDYDLMKDFMLRGYPDTERPALYSSLVNRMVRLTWRLQLHISCRQNSVFIKATEMARRFTDVDSLQRSLEEYVQEYALLSLDTGREDDVWKLNERHHTLLAVAFSWILSSPQWTAGDSSRWKALLLSPLVEKDDAALLISGITLSAMSFFDPQKVLLLLRLYCESDDELVRQRSLVGFALSLATYTVGIIPDIDEQIRLTVASADILDELAQLQKQVYLCMMADNDAKTIQQEILPEIMQQSKMHVDLDSLADVDDIYELSDRLMPSDDDDRIEQMEQSIHRMIDMQREGADIYFGGFSRTKRMPFFYDLVNWFCPFSKNHPAMRQTLSIANGDAFVDAMKTGAPFCDSDKYSFALLLPSVIGRLPIEMARQMADGIAAGASAMSGGNSPMLLRRMYLQDLYRFFRLSDFASSMPQRFFSVNPETHLFITSPLLTHNTSNIGAREQLLASLARFLYKKNSLALLLTLIGAAGDVDRETFALLHASTLRRTRRYEEAIRVSRTALERHPDSEPLKYCMARCLMQTGRYSEAEGMCSWLVTLSPDDQRYQLLHSLCLLETGRAAEALTTVSRLDYLSSSYGAKEGANLSDGTILRTLGWAKLLTGKAADAESIFNTFLTHYSSLHTPLRRGEGVVLGLAFAYWAQRKIAEAVPLLAEYVRFSEEGKDVRRTLEKAFSDNSAFFNLYAISEEEKQILIDLAAGQ